jgi:hypothetical protein
MILLVTYTSPFTPLLFALMPVLPIVIDKRVLPNLLTSPYACTLKQFCFDTVVGASSSKSTHSLFPGPLLESQKYLMFVTTTLCHDFRTHYLVKHSRACIRLVVSERRVLGLVWRSKYLFMYRRTVSTLYDSESLLASTASFWQVGGTDRRALHPPSKGGWLLGTPRALIACPP